MRSQRIVVVALLKACLLLSPLGFGLADLDASSSNSSFLRVGIQKEEARAVPSFGHDNALNLHRSRCDGSILSELLKEELWVWAHAEIGSFFLEFELGDLEVDLSEEEDEDAASSLEHFLLLGNSTAPSNIRRQVIRSSTSSSDALPEMEDATSTANRFQQNRYCNQETSDGLCHMFRAPLSIPSLTTASPKQRTRGGGGKPLVSRMATRIKDSLYEQIPGWMVANAVLIGTSCARDASSLQVSVEIVGGDAWGAQS
jgi:hypothetical protein